jgi:predicted GNAT family N-acyltransferase
MKHLGNGVLHGGLPTCEKPQVSKQSLRGLFMENFVEVKIAKNTAEINLCYQLRDTIFIQGQNVPAGRERDKYDNLAIHFLLFLSQIPIGVGRVVSKGDTAILGRLGILYEYRRAGAGLFLMNNIIDYCIEKDFRKIKLGAQEHAINFYKKLNFEICSKKYMDSNIPHFTMQLIL